MTREEAIKWLENRKIAMGAYSFKEYDEIIELLEALQERPKGQYIPDRNYRTLGNCSLCNADLTFLNNFCPNCGADMRGEQE